ncbi:MAG: flagellar protein FlaG [Desulfuromonas sp.]|nr:flagellar protein FlaG [Desulfuromonas sp.]
MKVESVGVAGSAMPQMPKASEQVELERNKKKDVAEESTAAAEKSSVQPEELLEQIKGLTEDGLYSVRFENDDDANQLVVKVVDRETDEVIRQVPAEEVLELSKRLDDLRGNIVNTQG